MIFEELQKMKKDFEEAFPYIDSRGKLKVGELKVGELIVCYDNVITEVMFIAWVKSYEKYEGRLI